MSNRLSGEHDIRELNPGKVPPACQIEAKERLVNSTDDNYFQPMTWKELCEDKRLQELPFKVELNGRGQIIMSPTRNWHGHYAGKINGLLQRLLPQGETIVECAVETSDGTKEADVAWLTKERFDKVKDEFSCSIAPEICVEIMSPANSETEMMEKKELYLRAGAVEFWLCDGRGNMRFFDNGGEIDQSVLCVDFPKSIVSR